MRLPDRRPGFRCGGNAFGDLVQGKTRGKRLIAQIRGHRRIRDAVDGFHRAETIEQGLDGSIGFEPREARTRTDVRSAPERDVIARVRPVESELVALVVASLVPIRRSEAHREPVTALHALIADRRILQASSSYPMRWRVVAQGFLYEDLNEFALILESIEESGHQDETLNTVREQPSRRVNAAKDHRLELMGDLDVAKPAAFDLGFQEDLHRVRTRFGLRALLCDPISQVGVDGRTVRRKKR